MQSVARPDRRDRHAGADARLVRRARPPEAGPLDSGPMMERLVARDRGASRRSRPSWPIPPSSPTATGSPSSDGATSSSPRRTPSRSAGAPPRPQIGEAREMLAAGDGDAETRTFLQGELAEAEEQPARDRGGDPPRDGRARPGRRQERDRRDPRRHGRRGGGAVRGRPLPACSRATPQRRGFKVDQLLERPVRDSGGFKDVTFEIARRRRVLGVQVGVRRAPRAARAGDRDAGPHPHLDRHGGGAARGRGGRGAIDPKDLAIDVYRLGRPGRPVGQHDRLRRARHARAVGHRRRLPGRALAAAEQGARHAHPARAHLRAGARGAGASRWPTRAARRSARASRSEKIRTYNFPQSRVTDHRVKHTSHALEQMLPASWTEFTDALQAEDNRRRLASA